MAFVAAIQMTSTPKVDDNLEQASRLLAIAAHQGVQLAILPEMFPLLGGQVVDKLHIKENPGSGKIQDFLSSMARKHGIWIVGGTVPLASKEKNKIRAACLVFNSSGETVGRYDKIHLFDAIISEKECYRESDTVEPGSVIEVIDTPVGRMGLCVCYDIRFPRFIEQLIEKRVEVIAVPAAFTVRTGKAHWELLVRCRAIDTFSYVVGACQSGKHSSTRKTYGHSMIVDPWGKIMAKQTSDHPGVIVADIDLNYLHQVRRNFSPTLHS